MKGMMTMDLIEAIKKRKSIRDYKSDPVPRETIKEILEISCRAPSSVNSQPWEFIVLTGDALDRIRQDNVERLRRGEQGAPDLILPSLPRDGIYRQRQVDLAKQLFTVMDIPRDDKEKRFEWMARGFKFFNAPAVIILLCDKALPEVGALMDIGAIMQTICLAALNHGLGTCIADQGIQYPDIVRRHVDLPETKSMLISIAIGYPNWDFPANQIETLREGVDNLTVWYGF